MADSRTPRYPRTIRRTAPQSVEIEAEPRRRSRRFGVQAVPLLLIGGFALAILIGTILLTLPISSENGGWTSPIVALFVSTSAVCVTGLTPVDTGTYWSGFGQTVILILFQFGGLGFMTSATLLFLLFGWRLGIRERLFLSQTLDLGRMGGIVRLIRRMVVFAFVAEAIGFVILSARFLTDHSFGQAVWHGLFHSVSAFNNAGFDLFGEFSSLRTYDDPITLITITILVFFGAIGYLVFEDLRIRRQSPISLDTKIILRTTAALIAAGFLLILILEWNGVLAGRSFPDKMLQAGFQAVASRTSGFSSVPIPDFTDESLFSTMGFMFIGGASGSTAGGIKVATFGILVAAAVSAVAGREHVEAAGRELRRADIDRALALAFLAILLVFAFALVLARIEPAPFSHVMFEATSAFGTTGLSAGITPNLKDASLLILTSLMFIGRLGPLTLALALVQRSRPARRRLPEDRVRIG